MDEVVDHVERQAKDAIGETSGILAKRFNGGASNGVRVRRAEGAKISKLYILKRYRV